MAVRKNFVGIQIGLISFLDEGVEPVLDILQQKAHVNALLPSTVSWSRGNAGRALDWYPDHGTAEPDNLMGGAMYNIHPQYYNNTIVKEFRAPDPEYQNVDFLELILPECQKRGIKVMPYYCETAAQAPRHIWQPNFVHLSEVDIHGRRAARPCFYNPEYRAWWTSVLEDHFRSYPIDGFVWGIERRSPLFNIIEGDVATCFCTHCREEATRRGLDVEGARRGYEAAGAWLRRVKAGDRGDGALVEFFRVMINNPAMMAWEKMWLEGHRQFYMDIYGTVKWFNPKAEVGMHVWQVYNTFHPFLKAQFDLEHLRQCSDWVKPVLYHDAAGPRFHNIVKNWTQTWLSDFAPEEATQFLYRILQKDEAPFRDLPNTGFSDRYVFEETLRTVRAVGPDVGVYPGLGVGVQGTGKLKPTPQSIREAVRASYEAGAGGVVLCRNYSEASLDCLAAVGQELDALGIGETIPEGVSKVDVGAGRGGKEVAQDRGF